MDKLWKTDDIADKLKQYFQRVYTKKEDWASCYTRQIFTAGIHSNSRIESYNSCIKRFLNSNTPINYFFKAIDEYEKAQILKTEIEN